MWESRRDFQRVWEAWEAGSMAFHASHTLSFPWSVFLHMQFKGEERIASVSQRNRMVRPPLDARQEKL